MFTTLTNSRTAALLLAMASLIIGLGAPASAAEADEPERLIRAGNDLRRKGDDLRAFGYLQRAYDIAHTPRAASQLGLCEQALGRFGEAEAHLSEALSTHDAWVDAKRASLESTRAVVRKQLGKVRLIGAPAAATVAVGKRPPQKLDADASLWLAPGPATLVIEAEGFRRATKSIVAALAQEVTVDAGLVSEAMATAPAALAVSTPARGDALGLATSREVSSPPGPSAAPPPAQSPGEDGGAAWRITGIVAGAAGVGMVAGGVVLRGIASDKLAAVDRDASNGQPYNPGNGNWKTFDGAALALFVAGGVAVVGGAALYLLNRSAQSTEATTAARPPRPVTVARRWPILLPILSLRGTSSDAPTAGILGLF